MSQSWIRNKKIIHTVRHLMINTSKIISCVVVLSINMNKLDLTRPIPSNHEYDSHYMSFFNERDVEVAITIVLDVGLGKLVKGYLVPIV